MQIPDHDQELLEVVYNFIADFSPDRLYLMGDQVNMTGVSKYDPAPNYHVSVMDEIHVARHIVQKIVLSARKNNKNAEIVWLDGNHEYRLQRYLASTARSIEELEVDGEQIVSIPNLFQFKQLGIKYVPYLRSVMEKGDVLIQHGTTVRKYAGYTAKAMIDSTGMSGISGHTHRLAFHTRTMMKKNLFWIENGSLCHQEPTPAYTTNPDWSLGFTYAYILKDRMFPVVVPIYNNEFIVEGKIYSQTNQKRQNKPKISQILRKIERFT